MKEEKNKFDYDSIPFGFYDEVMRSGHPIRRCWHYLKFQRIIECLPEGGEDLLDIGCFSGTFLSMITKQTFPRQLGVDILEKQIAYASQKYGTEFREFQYIKNLNELASIDRQFDCITLIEVIEHLHPEEIQVLLESIKKLLKPGAIFIFSTPNYLSAWPVLEILLNRFSDIAYEEQHITRFNYFNVVSKLARIYPDFVKNFSIEFKTTTHFLAPFLAKFSLPRAVSLSRKYPHATWRIPFGNLLLLKLRKKDL